MPWPIFGVQPRTAEGTVPAKGAVLGREARMAAAGLQPQREGRDHPDWEIGWVCPNASRLCVGIPSVHA